MLQNRICELEAQRVLGFASIVAGYTAIGTPLAHPSRALFISNLTDAALTFTNDTTKDMLTLAAGATFSFDEWTNGVSFPKGTQWYVKRLSIPTTLGVYIFSAYAIPA